jgi:glycosyltransferase involved in cell wall biosynthesis
VARYSFAAAADGVLGAAGRLARRRAARAAAGPPRVVACCGSMVIVSGVERMSFEVLRVLRERGAAVHCIVNTWDSARIVALAEEIGASWSTGYYWHPLRRSLPGPGAYLRVSWDVACTSAGLLRDAWRARATHVFVPDYTTAIRNAPALALLRAAGVRVVLRLGSAPEEGRFYRHLWRRAVAPLAGTIVCNSAFTRGALLAHGVPGSKAIVIHNTAPHRRSQTADGGSRAATCGPRTADPGLVMYVGQIIPPKGVDLLLEAAALLVARGLDVRVDVAGDIDGWEAPEYAGYRSRLRARAADPDLAGRVRFLGHREDVPALLAGAAVHCCPSRPEQREAFGVVNVEAKRAGIPSVVTPTGALPEIVEHRVDGWVAAEATAAALAEGLEYFLSDSARREEAGRQAARSEARFSRERFAASWRRVFEVPC